VPPSKQEKGEAEPTGPGASSGWKHGDDGRLRPELMSFHPVVGDRQIAASSTVNPRHCRITSATSSLRPLRLCGEKPVR